MGYTGIFRNCGPDGKVVSVEVGFSGNNSTQMSESEYRQKGINPPVDDLPDQNRQYLPRLGQSSVPALVPCPFCGSTDLQEDRTEDYIACYGCGASGPSRTATESPSEKWNKRYAG